MIGILSKAIPEPIKRRLRGHHNSIRGRFWDYPRELVEIQLYRLRGKGYLEWYADRLNKYASGQSAVASGMADRHRYFLSGDEDLEVLRDLGLKAEHDLLEIGCGFGRSAQHYVKFLDAGKYVGGDPAAERVRQCKELLEHRGLLTKGPQLAVIPDNTFRWVGGRKFDFIWAGAVFTHVPPADLAVIFRNAHTALKPTGQFVFTYTENERKSRRRFYSKDWDYDYAMFEDFAKNNGYVAENISQMMRGRGGHAVNDRLVRYRRA